MKFGLQQRTLSVLFVNHVNIVSVSVSSQRRSQLFHDCLQVLPLVVAWVPKKKVSTGKHSGRNYILLCLKSLYLPAMLQNASFSQMPNNLRAADCAGCKRLSLYSATGDNYCLIKCAERFAAWKAQEVQMLFQYNCLVLLSLFLALGENNACFVGLLKWSVIKTRACWLFCAFSLNVQIFVNLNSSGSR